MDWVCSGLSRNEGVKMKEKGKVQCQSWQPLVSTHSSTASLITPPPIGVLPCVRIFEKEHLQNVLPFIVYAMVTAGGSEHGFRFFVVRLAVRMI